MVDTRSSLKGLRFGVALAIACAVDDWEGGTALIDDDVPARPLCKTGECIAEFGVKPEILLVAGVANLTATPKGVDIRCGWTCPPDDSRCGKLTPGCTEACKLPPTCKSDEKAWFLITLPCATADMQGAD